ncbi:MAG: hypothetical protein L6V95_02890 [Candidatus Melainabacteria bacterium]|nr:MAG: hypothetical protein L6V95_02890 [Candidatus Melainabacteria bacterium]
MQKHFINVSLKQYNPKWEMVKVVPNVAAPFESQNEFQLYEMKTLVPQLLGRRQQLYTDKLFKLYKSLRTSQLSRRQARSKVS